MSKQARVRTRELREVQRVAAEQQARRKLIIARVSGVVIVALLVAIGFAAFTAVSGGDETAAPDRVVAPANLTEGGAIPVGEADAPVTVEIFFDYMCPACGAFESANGEELDRLVEDGTVRVELRPISFLDRTSNGTEYSTRTANAIATAVDGAPEQAWAFHRSLYAAQPEEGTDGLDDERIAEIAQEAGVPADVVDRFGDRTYEGWVASVTQEAFDSGVTGTPTVMIDGEEFDGDLFTEGPLAQAIESAAAGQ
ncbi:MAG TPA: DsbA family protein [Marmoricola sp.]|nr:DsbA family protein [Marmoricola sp.]